MGIKTPNNRSELEHNLFLIMEDTIQIIESGNTDLINNVTAMVLPDLKKVRILPNGRINLPTINEIIRLQANMKNSDLFSEMVPEDSSD